MKEISIFVDESGGQEGHSKYYALTLVFHEQSANIESHIEQHLRGLSLRNLADIPFHAGPLLNRHDEYKNMDIQTRKSYLTLFFMDVQHLPITYQTFLYRRNELGDKQSFIARMKRDISNLIFEELEYFQSFDKVKIYYDDGQDIVAKALHQAVEYMLSKDSIMFRKTKAADFMLAQAADLLCTLELTAVKYANKETTRTDEKFFGSASMFKRNYMKAIKRKRLLSTN